ncbi:oxygen-insensitive NADPH nitroreductase [Cytobacillus spongiae]|uniref:oxygen-insensitive NADPH nitroreductase n=1 Tax=Cytobacillus spongiae TaxID=2901381 RepID=UPI001F18BC34|nr:oxygen-insensitive NADPH nitroreductase [Cytobacillus spongiae]UII56671.1 oxygen-insensitive NADPH nitroreductase [Cytobacillus spongiae]
MNQVIETLINHRSIRSFEDKALTQEQIELIVRSAQAASTSSYIQAYSIVGVTDPSKKKRLAELAGNQPYVERNGHFFIFCADLYRHDQIGRMEKADVITSIESTEKFMVAIIDATLAAQNAAIAAESMGLGICYIGGIRNHLKEVCDIIKTPERVIPIFGLVVGYPNQLPDQKPRLSLNHIYHENEYEQNEERYKQELVEFNEVVSSYYQERTNGNRKESWTGQMAKLLEKQARMYMKEFIEEKKLNKK